MSTLFRHVRFTQKEQYQQPQWDSWITFVEHARNNYQCVPMVQARLLQLTYNVTSHTEVTGYWNLQYKKVRGVSMRQFLPHLWCVGCVNMRPSLCLIFCNTQETTLIVATRGVISFNLQQNWVPDQTRPFLIYSVLGMFAEKNDDYSLSSVLRLFTFFSHLWFHCLCSLRLG